VTSSRRETVATKTLACDAGDQDVRALAARPSAATGREA
jgi:hypothetical protein